MTMGKGATVTFPHDLKENVILAYDGIQQLPKLCYALSNMARRSRIQLERQGKFLGGVWPDKERLEEQTGILKSSKRPNLGQLSAYNEFWKTYSFTFGSDEKREFVRVPRASPLVRNNFVPRQPHLITHPPPSILSTLNGQAVANNKGICRSQITLFLESLPLAIATFPYLQASLFKHLNRIDLDSEEEHVLEQLRYLRTLFTIPIHKLLRERPKEFVLPLPRRASRAAIAQRKPLANYQSVRTLPSPASKQKCVPFKTTCESHQSMWKKSSRTCSYHYPLAVPKGAAFLTYPDLDSTSFEGTIGERRLIRWEDGTKFPQMGIDQSEEFKTKKECSRQLMIQNRLRGARSRKRVKFYKATGSSVNIRERNEGDTDTSEDQEEPFERNTFFYTPKRKTSQFLSYKPEKTSSHPFQLWLMKMKLRFKREPKVADLSQSSNNGTIGGMIGSIAERRNREALRAERKKRLKMCLGTTVNYLTCGISRCITSGECGCSSLLARARNLRTADSRERCQVGRGEDNGNDVFESTRGIVTNTSQNEDRDSLDTYLK